jgi:hypothetical protein
MTNNLLRGHIYLKENYREQKKERKNKEIRSKTKERMKKPPKKIKFGNKKGEGK